VNVLVKKYHVSAQELALVKLTRVHMFDIVIIAVIALHTTRMTIRDRCYKQVQR